MTDYTGLIRSLRNCSNNRCTPCDCGWFDKYQVDESCKEIIMWKAADAIEALQAQLPKRGKWIKHEDDACECSVCGLGLESFVEGIFYNFCPFCGADMRAKMEVQDDKA